MVSVSALISKQFSITGLHELFKQKSHHQMCLLFRHQYLLHLWIWMCIEMCIYIDGKGQVIQVYVDFKELINVIFSFG